MPTANYDVGQGQGWQRNIVMNGSPHVPASIRQWYGDSRGHWEGNTLVIDVTNFSPKTDVSRLARKLAPGRALDAHRATDARLRGHDRGPDGVDEALDRQAGIRPAERRRRTAFITSRAASKAISACRDCCTAGAWKSVPSRRGAVPIRAPWTPSVAWRPCNWTRCSSAPGTGCPRRAQASCALH